MMYSSIAKVLITSSPPFTKCYRLFILCFADYWVQCSYFNKPPSVVNIRKFLLIIDAVEMVVMVNTPRAALEFDENQLV